MERQRERRSGKERETWPLRYFLARSPYLLPFNVGYETHATLFWGLVVEISDLLFMVYCLLFIV